MQRIAEETSRIKGESVSGIDEDYLEVVRMFILFEDLWQALTVSHPQAAEAYFEERKRAEAFGAIE
jgi:hypothetical protein